MDEVIFASDGHTETCWMVVTEYDLICRVDAPESSAALRFEKTPILRADAPDDVRTLDIVRKVTGRFQTIVLWDPTPPEPLPWAVDVDLEVPPFLVLLDDEMASIGVMSCRPPRFSYLRDEAEPVTEARDPDLLAQAKVFLGDFDQ